MARVMVLEHCVACRASAGEGLRPGGGGMLNVTLTLGATAGGAVVSPWPWGRVAENHRWCGASNLVCSPPVAGPSPCIFDDDAARGCMGLQLGFA